LFKIKNNLFAEWGADPGRTLDTYHPIHTKFPDDAFGPLVLNFGKRHGG
jgi:hypothetical protein